MSINPVSIGSNITSTPFSDNNVIKLLEKQKQQLQEQIEKTNESKMDDKTKRELVKQLQDQIQQIDMDIQQKRNEKLNTNKNMNTNPNPQTANNQSNGADGENNNLAGMSDLFQASATYSQIKTMSNTKSSLMGKGRILKKEIEVDEARSLSGSKAVAKRQELIKIESSGQGIDKKMAEANQKVQKQIKEASTKVGKIDENNETKELNPKDDVNPDAIAKELKSTEYIHKKIDIKI